MKSIREGFLRKNLSLGKDEIIKKWLDNHGISDYKINLDLTIDVNGSVMLYRYKESQLPDYIQFNKVTGFFACQESEIESLRGFPKSIFKNLNLRACKNLKSLKDCPQKIFGSLSVSSCENLNSLDGCPKEIGGDFDCSGCISLKTLKGAPKKIGGDFYCNYYKFTEYDVTKYCDVTGIIYT